MRYKQGVFWSENAPDILSDNAQCEQLDAAQEQNNDYQVGKPAAWSPYMMVFIRK